MPSPSSRCAALALLALAGVANADPAARSIDLATLGDDVLLRVYGNREDGGQDGVPVAGGFDLDGDGYRDVAMASMLASPEGRAGAGEVFVLFGDGTIAGSFDTAVPDARILRIVGDGASEATGSEIWMDDVTGDGLGDLLIARQNFTPPEAGRIGAGALTIIAGSPALRTLAEAGTPIDLRAPPVELAVTTVIGVGQTSRLGIWIRTGDVTGDGIADVAVGSDQESSATETHRGAAYLLRGGAQLAATQSIDLAAFGSESFAFAADVARVRPPAFASEYHFGGTVDLADLDGDGHAELLAAATIARVGGGLLAAGAPPGSAHDKSGAPDGTLYIAWAENFAGAWNSLDLALDDPGVVATSIHGGTANVHFGEEIAGGRDFDGDGAPDLFAGDLVANAPGRPAASGLGHLLSGVDDLRGAHFDLDAPPANVAITTFEGAVTGEIAADTAITGDFDGDGRADLAFSSPHAWPLDRVQAGVVHIFHGGVGAWPPLVDLAPGALPPASVLRVTEVLGANGAAGFDRGDTLAYSAAVGDIDADGKDDLIVNEMLGDGIAVDDAGTLIVVSGKRIAPEPEGGALAIAAFATIAAMARRQR